MTTRLYYSESEKNCLHSLITKYNLGSVKTASAKRVIWTQITQEYNSVKSNNTRTEVQLKKCWDNMKMRRKALAQARRERLAGGAAPTSAGAPPQHLRTSIFVGDIEVDGESGSAGGSCPPSPPPALPPPPLTKQERHDDDDDDDHGLDFMERFSPGYTECSVDSFPESAGSAAHRRGAGAAGEAGGERAERRAEELHRLRVAELRWAERAARERYRAARLARAGAELALRRRRARPPPHPADLLYGAKRYTQ